MKENKTARLILENGAEFKGRAFGYVHDVVGEVVFTTNMTGYQETLTDPSFCGQIVVMTYPLIGNYGVNFEDMEADQPALSAFVVREKCDYPSNFRTEMDLDGFLRQNKVVGLEGIDTRALTRIIRESGCMKGIITTKDLSESAIKKKLDSLDNRDVISRVSCKKSYKVKGEGTKIAFIDMGCKAGIIRDLKSRGCAVTVFPYNAKAKEILKSKPELVFISNGPGDPMDVPETVKTVKELIGKVPLCGICMGHQIIGLALGCKTEKLKFGHHGGNHPVKNLETGKVYISSQNHNYILADYPEGVEELYINVNDGTCEGIKHKTLPIRSVQFHPEASPGPLDTGFIFDNFLTLVEGGSENA